MLLFDQKTDANVLLKDNDSAAGVLLELPKGVSLPISDDVTLNQLDEKLKEDKHLQSVLVRELSFV